MGSIFDIGNDLNQIGQGISNSPVNGIINSVGNVFDTLSGKSSPPTYNAPTMDPTSQAQIAGQENNLMKTPQQQTAGIMNNTGAAGAVQNQTQNQVNEQNEQGGGGINGMTQAIGNKAQKNFATSQGRLQQNANLQGQQMANTQQNQAAMQAIALSNAQAGVTNATNQLQLQYNQAQYNTVSSIMAGAGTGAGYYFGKNSVPGPMNPAVNAQADSIENQFQNPAGENSTGYLGSNVETVSPGLLGSDNYNW